MKKLINLIFDRIERLLWQRHVLWTLRDNHNFLNWTDSYPLEEFKFFDNAFINWVGKRMNDYKGWSGKDTATENSTDVRDDKS